MKKGLLLISGLVVSMAATANTVDVFGLSQEDAKPILKKYSQVIAKMEPVLIQETMNQKPDRGLNQSLKKIIEKKYSLLQEITKNNDFLFVDFQTIFYPEDNSYSTTIEVVDKQHPERMKYVSHMPLINDPNTEQKATHRPDLIDAMNACMNKGLKMLMRHQIPIRVHCPVYHCVAGFDHPVLKPYLPMFNEGAIKNKKLIIETLRHDKNPDRRAAAAFLVGHFQDPREIISALNPSVTDRDEGVRNNVMRVIAETIRKSKITDIDVKPFLRTLDSPYTIDRNKALFVLMGAADNQASKQIILRLGGNKLVKLMELKQPNNHDTAYIILKKISGKDFGSKNVAAWKKWVDSAQNQAG